MTEVDATRFERYRAEAELCHQMAEAAVGEIRESWLRLSAEWLRLERDLALALIRRHLSVSLGPACN